MVLARVKGQEDTNFRAVPGILGLSSLLKELPPSFSQSRSLCSLGTYFGPGPKRGLEIEVKRQTLPWRNLQFKRNTSEKSILMHCTVIGVAQGVKEREGAPRQTEVQGQLFGGGDTSL